MDIDKLIQLAADELSQPSEETATEFSSKRDEIAVELNRRMGQRPDLDRLIGEGNHNMMEDNHRNQTRFIESQMMHFSPEVLVETIMWVMSAYPNHGFTKAYFPAVLDEATGVIKDLLSEKAYEEVYPFYHWMIVHHPGFVR